MSSQSSPLGGANLFSRSVAVTAITHSIAVNSAPGLSEDIVVIIVQNPFEAPAAHGGAETTKGSVKWEIMICSANCPCQSAEPAGLYYFTYSLHKGSSKQSVLMQPLNNVEFSNKFLILALRRLQPVRGRRRQGGVSGAEREAGIRRPVSSNLSWVLLSHSALLTSPPPLTCLATQGCPGGHQDKYDQVYSHHPSTST